MSSHINNFLQLPTSITKANYLEQRHISASKNVNKVSFTWLNHTFMKHWQPFFVVFKSRFLRPFPRTPFKALRVELGVVVVFKERGAPHHGYLPCPTGERVGFFTLFQDIKANLYVDKSFYHI